MNTTEQGLETLTVTVTAERYPSSDGTVCGFNDAEKDCLVDAVSAALDTIGADYWRIGFERTGGQFDFSNNPLDELA